MRRLCSRPCASGRTGSERAESGGPMTDASLSELRAEAVIRLLDLKPHPEGGFFRETFRDARAAGERPASTAIYYLLGLGDVSEWHRVDAAEVWHFYAGAPLVISVSPNATTPQPTTSARTSPAVIARSSWCRRGGGRRRRAWVPGRSSVARSRPASTSPDLNSPRPAGGPHRGRAGLGSGHSAAALLPPLSSPAGARERAGEGEPAQDEVA
jgi:Cupin superfamily (DUF985)